MKAVGVTWWYFVRKRKRLELSEEFDSRIALMPFVKAESDRLVLKQCIKMREAEKEIMKDVPHWELGKYAGQELYQNEQHHFDSLLAREFETHTKPVALREKARVALGMGPRYPL